MPPGWLTRASPDRPAPAADSILAIPVRGEPLELGRSGRTSALVQDLDRGVGDARLELLADEA